MKGEEQELVILHRERYMEGIKSIDKSIKKILLRLDLDVPIDGEKIVDATRLDMTLPTATVLLERGARVTMIGHLGRPRGVADPQFSLKPIRAWYSQQLRGRTNWELWENLRFEAGEEAADDEFARDIVRRSKAQVYVFDAFAVSHRPHASVVKIPKLLPTFVGVRFEQEISQLSSVLREPKRPLVYVIGGAKPETKLPLVLELAKRADWVLVGGTLPKLLQGMDIPKNVATAALASDGLDISDRSIQEFSQIISTGGTVVWNGPMGKFEDAGHELGTKQIAQAVNDSPGYTIIGGGDTEAAATLFNAESGIDWICSGGGAMLYYLAYGTLPFLESLGSSLK